MRAAIISFLLCFYSLAHGQYLTRLELESIDSCYYCSGWSKEEKLAKDSLKMICYYDQQGEQRRYEKYDSKGVRISLIHTDETGNQTGLNYALYPNYTTRNYWFAGGGYGVNYFFDEQQRLVEITYTHLYGVIDREIIFDKQGRILYHVEIDETDAYNWKYSVYDKRGRIREEGFEYNQTPYGIWKYYDRKGKLTKTKDFGDRINP